MRSEGKVAKGVVKPSTVHQDFRVLRRMLNVAVRKKLLVANPCSGVEFPVRVKGLFRLHYMTCFRAGENRGCRAGLSAKPCTSHDERFILVSISGFAARPSLVHSPRAGGRPWAGLR